MDGCPRPRLHANEFHHIDKYHHKIATYSLKNKGRSRFKVTFITTEGFDLSANHIGKKENDS
jgi:hypothetical protein